MIYLLERFQTLSNMKDLLELQQFLMESESVLKHGHHKLLRNNIILIFINKIFSIGVFIGAGSRNETLTTSGAAHFLEHLHFKGTKSRSRTQLEKEVENMGA